MGEGPENSNTITLLFGTRGLGEQGLLSGWARPQRDHVWNDGSEAVLQLIAPHADDALTLAFETFPFLTDEVAAQDVAVFVNGWRIRSWRLTEKKVHYLEFEVPQEFFFRRPEGVVLNLTWVLPNAASPRALQIGNDGRELGLCFRALTLKS